ncbi:MAG: aminodeoxychorismate/anthranilate synthase component II [Bacteroidota bacterium]
MGRILIIDNYDSFTYNIVHYVTRLTGTRPDVFRNDEIQIERIGSYDKIVISPGPGIPVDAGICLELIRKYAPERSILGVCLGHQAIGEAFGARLRNLDKVYHGIEAPVIVTEPSDYLFKGIDSVFNAGRYHSWVVDRGDLPDCLRITCVDENGLIMAISHNEFDVKGVQFHPESVMTKAGMDIMKNWIEK